MGLFSKHKPDSSTQKVEGGGDASTSSTLSPGDVNENGLEDASFPQQQRFWHGGDYHLLGSGIRYYKLGFIHVKVGQHPAAAQQPDTSCGMRHVDTQQACPYSTSGACSAASYSPG